MNYLICCVVVFSWGMLASRMGLTSFEVMVLASLTSILFTLLSIADFLKEKDLKDGVENLEEDEI